MPVEQRAATSRQLYVCRRIAERTGHTFPEPLSSFAASRFIAADAARRQQSKGNGLRLTPTPEARPRRGTNANGLDCDTSRRDAVRVSGFV